MNYRDLLDVPCATCGHLNRMHAYHPHSETKGKECLADVSTSVVAHGSPSCGCALFTMPPGAVVIPWTEWNK